MTKKELKNFLGIINKNKCNMKSIDLTEIFKDWREEEVKLSI